MSDDAVHPGGRPSSYDPIFCEQAEKLCRLGATDQELADFFGVTARTIYRWQAQYPEFCHALKSGKESADERVERSLYHRAVGYTFDSEKVFQFQGQIVRAPTKEHVPPDTTAMIFWLKNRRPEMWRDKRDVTITDDRVDDASDEELLAALAELRSVKSPRAHSKNRKGTGETAH